MLVGIIGKLFHNFNWNFNMIKNEIRIVILMIFAFIILSTMLCVFPDSVEYPVTTADIDTLLNFKNILSENNEKFTFNFYEELFINDFKYKDLNISSSKEYSKSDVITRLNRINAPGLSVVWNKNTNVADPTFTANAPFELQPREYTIQITEKNMNGQDSILVFTGEAVFEVVYSKLTWKISKWYDKNTTINHEKSYFHPLFNE